MKKTVRVFALAIVFLFALGLLASPAYAESPSKTDCEAGGGTYTHIQGVAKCTTLDPVGNSESDGGHSQKTKDTESSNGTLQNAPHHQDSCLGPGNSGEGGGPCD
jgi:hypothetical protein